MHRIDTISAQKDKFGAGKNGFTTGDPQSGTPATEVSAEILDALQEEICAAIEGAGITLDKGKNNQLLAAIQSSIYPVGAPIPWPLATPPAGFMLMTGQSFSAATYPRLAQAYPSLTLPDMRGEFIRGWDNGRGVDAARALLSAQGAQISDHVHHMSAWTGAASNLMIKGAAGGGAVAATQGDGGVISSDIDATGTNNAAARIGVTRGVSGISGELHPRNTAFNIIVRAA